MHVDITVASAEQQANQIKSEVTQVIVNISEGFYFWLVAAAAVNARIQYTLFTFT